VNAVLLDTGPIVALLDSSERRHRECAELATTLDIPLVTCEAVIAEACYLLRDLKGAATAVMKNVESGNFLIPYRVTGRTARLVKLINKYADLPMDFADACLVDLASQLSIGRIFTLDSDFCVYRWGRNRPFDMLLNP